MSKRAVTLVELVVAVFISSLVLGAAYSVWRHLTADVSRATVRQQIQSETRRALTRMADDFRAVKAGTINISQTGTRIEFERFRASADSDDEELFSSEIVDRVVYEFDQPVLTRALNNTQPVVLGTNFETIVIERGLPDQNVSSGDTQSEIDRERALNARLDISISSRMINPSTNDYENHRESVSVFMRDEYHATINRGSAIRLASLMDFDSEDDLRSADAANFGAVAANDGIFSIEDLRQLNDLQLDLIRETNERDLEATNERLEELNGVIAELCTSRHPNRWIFRGSNELRPIQRDIERADQRRSWGRWGPCDSFNDVPPDRSVYDEAIASLDGSIDTLNEKIKRYERDVINTAFKDSSPGFDIERLKQSENNDEYELYKEAYELALADHNLKEAHEQSNDDSTSSYQSLIVNPDDMRQGRGVAPNGDVITWEETEADFLERRRKAADIYRVAQKINIDRVLEEKEEEMRMHSTAKEFVNLAETKKLTLESKYILQRNKHKIQTVTEERARQG